MRYTLLAGLLSLLLLACCGSNAIPHGNIHTVTEKRNDSTDTVQQWLVVVDDDATIPQINQAFQFLVSLTDTMPGQILRSDGLFLFWVLDMTEEQRDQALNHPYITIVELNLKLVDDTRVPRVGSSSPKERRGGQDTLRYAIQPLAVRELAAISQPRYAHATSCGYSQVRWAPMTG